MFLLSKREENTRTLCRMCSHYEYDDRTATGRCTRPVRIEVSPNTYAYVRLACLSRSGAECQMFDPKGTIE